MVSFNKQLQQLLKNKYVLYIVFFFAITNVLGFLSVGDYKSLTFFVGLVVVASYFSKNMIVNLLFAMVFTNMFFVGRKIEAMTNKKSKNSGSDAGEHDDDEDGHDDEETESTTTTQE
jgi:hypothetical protein